MGTIIFFFIKCRNEPEVRITRSLISSSNSFPQQELIKQWNKILEIGRQTYLVFENDTFYSIEVRVKMNLHDLLFTNGKSFTPLSDSVMELLNKAHLFGLEKKFLGFDTLCALKNILKTHPNPAYWLEWELRLSEAVFSVAKTFRYGYFYNDSTMVPRDFSMVDSVWLSVMKQGIQNVHPMKSISCLFPGNPFFACAYRQYRTFLSHWEKYPNYPPFPADTLSADSLLKYLKLRFGITGELDTMAHISDSIRVARALKKFQKTWNLEPDGKVGKLTLLALRLSKEEWLGQVQMSLDRYRREPEKFPKKFLWLNIPSADFFLFDFENKKFLSKVHRTKKLRKAKKEKLKEDTIALYSRVVVGKPETPTPLLDAQIGEMIIYPYWNVPFKIAVEEILPMVQRDTAYLRKKNFEVIGASGKPVPNAARLPWKKYNKEYFPVRIRQRIGADNSLGVVKFNFHNPYGVYLHDTNSKRYFRTFYRYQSHGCMRVEKYKDLARYLIRDDTLSIPFDTLDKWLTQPEQRKIRIKSRLPLKVRYYTFRPDTEWIHYETFVDIYGWDKKRWIFLNNKLNNK